MSPMTTEVLADVLREVWHPSNVMDRTSKLLDFWDWPRPRFAFLTQGYVEHLGLKTGQRVKAPYPKDWPDALGRPLQVSCDGVVFDGWFYAQEFEGGYRAIHPVAVELPDAPPPFAYPANKIHMVAAN